MFFASDNTSGVPAEIMAALTRANEGYARSYGNDDIMARVTARIRALFDAPDAVVHLVATGTAANALALATLTPPWGAIFCHRHAHIAEDECGAPEFFAGGAKLALIDGPHGKITPEALTESLATTGASGVHGVQRGALSLTNVTEAGTCYTPAEIAALTAIAKQHDLPCHLDGARFANALIATGATPAEMTWKAGIDALSFGGTKNGLLGVEAVILFDPAKSWDLELRRKRGGHLFSKHRFLSAQMEAYLQDDLWLRLARHANSMGQRLSQGIASMNSAALTHPTHANMVFANWEPGGHARLQGGGAIYYDLRPTKEGRETARMVASWNTTDDHVDRFLALLKG